MQRHCKCMKEQVAVDSPVPEMMKIGHTNQSMTVFPEISCNEKFTFVDCPGFLDNRQTI